MSSNKYTLVYDLVEKLNEAVKSGELDIGDKLQTDFDELGLDKDSISLSLGVDDVPDEAFADVTGTAYVGTIKLEVYYRAVSKVKGKDDLKSMELLQSIVDYILYTYNFNQDGMFIINKKCTVSPRLLKVYNGNIRDFITKLNIEYERMV